MPIKRFPPDATAAEIRSLTPPAPVEAVAEIIESIRRDGDGAILEQERRHGSSAIASGSAPLRVARDFLAASELALDTDLRAALELAIKNVRAVAAAQLDDDKTIQLEQGQSIRLRQLPVARAAIYVPGGRGSYPSTAYMCAVPALAAGVGELVVTTPARGEDGQIDATVAAVCSMLGVTEVYAVGGAHAIAALALGTQTIKPVDVIVGPGNSYVQEAKRQLVGRVGIDGVAGPSELVIVAGEGADPEPLALDLLAQGEHGPDSLVVLLTPEPDLIDRIVERAASIEAQLAIVLTHDVDAALELADAIAPEHLQVLDPEGHSHELAGRVRNAGVVFVGQSGATAFGDYVAGSNHVLPTGGAARFASALSPATFRRRMAEISLPDAAVEALAGPAALIAKLEGFPLHGQSMTVRTKAARERADGAQEG